MSDYILPFPYQHRDLSPGLLDERRRREEYQALQLLFRDPKLATKLEEVKKNFAVKAHGKNAASGLGALFLFNREAAKSEATSKVTLANGDQRFFFHREFVKSRSTGVEKMRIDLGQSDILVANRKRIRITTEMDRDKPEKFLLILRNEDFYRLRKVKAA